MVIIAVIGVLSALAVPSFIEQMQQQRVEGAAEGLFAQTNSVVYGLLMLVVSVIGIWICGIAADKLGEHDFGGIVWDEIAGYLITMCLVPLTWQTIIVGFILFRIFDILKPWPISWLDRYVQGGFGIMIDDVLAGIFAGALLLLAFNWGWIS
jgi:phosphatidylglycerophosphatase A